MGTEIKGSRVAATLGSFVGVGRGAIADAALGLEGAAVVVISAAQWRASPPCWAATQSSFTLRPTLSPRRIA